MNPNSEAEKLIKQYATNNPFEICDYKNIVIIKQQLGKIKGCYKLIKRSKVIFLNIDLDYCEEIVVCGHELGHAIMHPYTNCNFLQNYTLFLTDKLEIQANTFCAHLLLPSVEEYEGYTYEAIAAATHIPPEIVRLRKTSSNFII